MHALVRVSVCVKVNKCVCSVFPVAMLRPSVALNAERYSPHEALGTCSRDMDCGDSRIVE